MIALYKPTKNNTGALVSFKYNKKYDSLFIEMAKQTGWDDAKKRGSFKNSPVKIVAKFTTVEAATIIDAIENNREFKIFHSNDSGSTAGSFCPYLRDNNQVGHSLSLTQKNNEKNESNSLRIGFTFGEGVMIKEFLKTCLSISNHSAINKQNEYALNKYKENQNNGGQNTTTQPQTQPKQQAAEAKDDWANWDFGGNSSQKQEENDDDLI
jgi:hypothetical protein